MLRFALCFLLLLGSNQIQADGDVPFSHEIPTDIATMASGEHSPDWIHQHQQQVNRHAWRTFVSLMWPAQPKQRGEPHIAGQLKHAGLRVWETWKEQYEVYPKDGSAPAPWHAPATLPSACHAEGNSTLRYLYRNEKVDDVLDAVNQAVKADATLPGTLKDQDGKLVRYEIRLNRRLFNYIVKNKLYNGEQQIKADKINFPNGSMLIKAAWRELTPATHAAARNQFMTRQACICEDDEQQCHQAEVALVGFHIMHKTPSAPQWIWSTFEHVANVQPSHGLPASFNNPHCQGEYCTPNSQTPNDIPNQVTQLLPIPPALQKLNQRIQQRFERLGSVLSRYQLMSAQWPIQRPESKEHPTVFNAQPVFSANTTMETFAQTTSSCMGCHVMSRTMRMDKFVSGDFSFTLNNAHPQPAGAVCGSYDYSNSISCSDDIILFSPADLADYPARQQLQITLGYFLVSQTYELLPDNVGNRLHCRSCHLHAGGEPKASWWVGMDLRYQTKADLQGRINGCFERSMNGKDLCTPGNDCDSNQNMSAIIAYMDWLTDAYKKKHDCTTLAGRCTPPHGFPPLTNENVKGNSLQGKAIFAQKCAFCHNSQGQGRYASDVYFRPALWGADSYNGSAGMAETTNFARFARWNMPYGSGGLLTDQEAKDLACFVNAQSRPGEAKEPDEAGCLSNMSLENNK